MFSVSYHPCFDPYHTVGRFLTILYYLNGQAIELKRLQIFDFYCVFPHYIKKIRHTPEARKAMRSIDIDRIEAPYSIVPHPTVVFEQMAPVQWAGLNALVSRDLAKIENGYVSQDIDRLFSLFGKIKSEHHYLDLKVLGFFMNNYFGHSLQGMNGLKARTGLMEHKYDAA